MSNLNKVLLIGRLGADPEMKHLPNGNAVVNLRIATSEKWKDKRTGDQQERTEWHNVTAYERLAEIFAEYTRKGSLVYVEGKLQTRKWQDKDGKDRYTTEIIAREMQMLGGRGDAPQKQAGYDWKGAEQRERTAADNVREAMEEPAFDDDIPF